MKSYKAKIDEVMGPDHPDVKRPEGKLFKDKLGHLHLVVGGSRAHPMSLTFDPKWGQINSYGSFGNSLTSGEWIPWTNMVKKAIVKKFMFAIEYELEKMRADPYAGKFMLDNVYMGEQALKYLKHMGR